MNWGILAFVIIYEVLTVVGVGLVIARKINTVWRKETLHLQEKGCRLHRSVSHLL